MKDNQIADTQKPQEENNGDFSFDSEFENDSNDAIKELLEKYYEAYAQGDTAELEKVATPVSDNEKSYISVLSKYYEKIMNITYYSKQGPTDGSYFVISVIKVYIKLIQVQHSSKHFFLPFK